MGNNTKDRRPQGEHMSKQAHSSSGWAIAALVLGLAALLLAPFIDTLLWQWLVWGLHDRVAYAVLAPFVRALLPAIALVLGIVALLRPGRKARALVGMAAAVLALAIICYLAGPKAQAHQSCCLSNVRQLTNAQLMYFSDYDERFPPAHDWASATQPYAKNFSILCCPSDFYSDPKGTHGRETSYCMNIFLSGAGTDSLGDRAPTATIPLLFEGAEVAGGPEVAAYRHFGGLNLSYADGHAEYLKKDAFLQLRFEPPGQQ